MPMLSAVQEGQEGRSLGLTEEHGMFRSQSIPARLGRLGATVVVAAAGTLTLFQGVSNAAATYTALPASGPSASATYVLTVTGTGFTDAAGVSLVHAAATGVQFAVTAACAANEGASTTAGGVNATFNVISATRLAVTTPAAVVLVGSATSTAYKVCVFDTTTNNLLLGSATYTVYAAPTITAANVPASGPVFGNNTISITGTGFTTTSKVTVGGVAATNVKITGTTNITASAPAHAVGAVTVVVTTQGGPNPPSVAPNATWDDYLYKSAVSVSPAFGQIGSVIDVTGVGFSAMDFATPTAAVMFVSGVAYSPVESTPGNSTKTHGAAGVCLPATIQVLSDTELVCVVPTLTDSAYTVTVVNDYSFATVANLSTFNFSAVSSGATFTVSAF
jgi:hypothetical protein